jgi:hypothetical protein
MKLILVIFLVYIVAICCQGESAEDVNIEKAEKGKVNATRSRNYSIYM